MNLPDNIIPGFEDYIIPISSDNGEWCNNLISKKLNLRYKHDFSICDVDGVCRCFYKIDDNWITRMVIYESKHKDEIPSQTQLQSLYYLDNSIKWEIFDKRSGLFLLRIMELDSNNEPSILEINKIIEIGWKKYFLEKIKGNCTISFEQFYNWISAKDKRK